MIPIAICFDPKGRLEVIELYPQHFGPPIHRDWADWTEEEEKKDLEHCEKWLSKHCGLEPYNNELSWGFITAYWDPRSQICGVAIKYTE